MKENKTIDTMKKVTRLICGLGIATIVGCAVGHVCPTSGMGAFKKACVLLGTGALGGMCCNASSDYINETIDRAAEFAEGMLKETPEEVVEAEIVGG